MRYPVIRVELLVYLNDQDVGSGKVKVGCPNLLSDNDMGSVGGMRNES